MARIHVILSDDVVAAIDKRFGERGRSRFLEAAARETLERLELDEALVSVAGTISEQDHPEFADQASINEWVRAQRRTEEAS
jgi:metal-responsive CopG/Arc/MetJ family transcriptional regulator